MIFSTNLPIGYALVLIALLCPFLFAALRHWVILPRQQIQALTAQLAEARDDAHKQKEKVLTLLYGAEELACSLADAQKQKTKISVLLDNIGEGFLSFNRHLQIAGEYSTECTHIFAEEIAGCTIYSLLFPQPNKQRTLFQQNLRRIFREPDEFKQNLLLSLLPQQFTLHGKIIQVSYKMLSKYSMMMRLVDITQAELLKQQLLEEKKRLLFVVAVVSDAKEFFTLSEDYRIFIEHGCLAILQQAGDAQDKLQHLYRDIHTFKGVFLQKALLHTPQTLHALECELSSLKEQPHLTIAQLETVIAKHDLAASFQADWAYLQSVLGKQYFDKKDTIQVSESLLHDCISLAAQLSEQVADEGVLKLLKTLQRLRYVDIKSLLASYPNATEQLAARLNKQIAPFAIEGDAILVDPDYFSGFSKALIHLFRNVVDHGIETPELREEQNKAEQGRVRCIVQRTGDAIVLTVEDDGAGIDVAQLKQIALASGRYSAAQLDALSPQQSLELVFEHGLSSAEQVSLISGQGVGLAAVRAELKKIKGNVSVTSTIGQGCCFRFTIPYTTGDYE